ncbi:hypothetical protein FACS1894122_03310 [Alphaproteobacteria bacterium]|nr:hypothetical protein FACS1894122_03310 [Alphaproteobacteria bacterium]
MAKDTWGIKRVCQGCGIRFYDFNTSPIICPSCGAQFDPEHLYKRKTKNSQEKSEEVDDVVIDVVDDDSLVVETDDIDDLDDSVAVLDDSKDS